MKALFLPGVQKLFKAFNQNFMKEIIFMSGVIHVEIND